MKLIGLRIVSLRKKQKISTNDFTKGIISHSYLSNIEHCRKVPSMETLLDFAERLNVHEKQLILEEEKLHTPQLFLYYKKIFQFIILEEYSAAEKFLETIEKQYQLNRETAETEFTFHILRGIVLLKQWNFSQYDELEKNYLRFLKGIDSDLLCSQAKYYYFFLGALKENAAMDYESSIEQLDKALAIPELPAEYILVAQMAIAINYIGVSDYEMAIQTLEQTLVNLKKVSFEYQGFIVKIYYLFGFVYYYIRFYKLAKKYFSMATACLKKYPTMKSSLGILILYWSKQVSLKLEEETEVTLINQQLFDVFNEKYSEKELLSKNDYLPISELLIDFVEAGEIKKAEELHKYFKDMSELPKDIRFFIEYSEAIMLYHQKGYQPFDEKISLVFAEINQSNNPDFILRAKKFVSKLYADHKKYKRSFEILYG